MFAREEVSRAWAYNLHRLRTKAGMSKYELAKRAGLICDNPESKVNTIAISRFEDDGKMCSFDTLLNIAEALGVTAEELLRRSAPKGWIPPKWRKKKRGGGGKEAA